MLSDKKAFITYIIGLLIGFLCGAVFFAYFTINILENQAMKAKVGQYDKQTGEFVFKCQKCGGE